MSHSSERAVLRHARQQSRRAVLVTEHEIHFGQKGKKFTYSEHQTACEQFVLFGNNRRPLDEFIKLQQKKIAEAEAEKYQRK